MIKYILDTNIVSEPIRINPNLQVLEHLKQHETQSAITSISWHELIYGLNRLPSSKKKTQIEIYLRQVIRPTLQILPYTHVAAEWHAEERARLESNGHARPFADGQIAAIAATGGLILVTRNVVDFSLFNDLHVENWFE